MRVRFLTALGVLLWVQLSVAAPQTIMLNEKDVIELSLRHNLAIRKQLSTRVSQRWTLFIAERAFKPQLNEELKFSAGLHGRGVKNGIVTNTPFGLSVTNPALTWKNKVTGGTFSASAALAYNFENTNLIYPVSVDYTQPLLRGFGSQDIIQNGLLGSYEAEEGNRIEFRNTLGSNIMTVLTKYRGLIQSKRTFKIAQQDFDRSKKNVETEEARFQVGKAAKNANLEMKRQFQQSVFNARQAELTYSNAKRGFLQVLGIDALVDFDVPDDFNIDVNKFKIPTEKEVIEEALRNNPTWVQTLIGMRGKRRALKIANNSLLWDVNLKLGASFGGDGTGNKGGFPSFVSGNYYSNKASLSVGVPFDDPGRKRDFQLAKITFKNAQLELDNAKRVLVTSAKNQVNGLIVQVEQIKNAEGALKFARKSYEITRVKLDFGRASEIDLTQSQKGVVDAETQYVAAKLTYITLIDDLYQFLGKILDRYNVTLEL